MASQAWMKRSTSSCCTVCVYERGQEWRQGRLGGYEATEGGEVERDEGRGR